MIGTATMYSFTSKIFTVLCDPLAVVMILIVCAWLFRKRRPALFHSCIAVTLLLLIALASPTVSQWLLGTLESQYPDRGISAEAPAQAIVVLGGTINMPSDIHRLSGITNSSDRLLMGMRLYRAGKAPLVEVTGGDSPLLEKARSVHEADEMRSLLDEWGVPDSAIIVEDASVNTHENALFTRRVLEQRGIQHIILVTSAIHMPRAAAAFRKAGFDVEAAPADFLTGWEGDKVGLDWLPASGALLNSNNAIHEWVGLWVYRLRGWA
jgi:uncharacterized SAM-binding protein YcdF (DUF218 family)